MKVLTAPSSGSIAGTTFSHNRAGQYTRNRRTPVVGTRTPRQGVVKGNLAESSRAWQNLTAADQNSWTSFANAHPVVDSLGQSIKLTGHQYYVRCSASLLNVGQPPLTATPASVAVTAETIAGWSVAATGAAFCVRGASAGTDFWYASLSKYTSLGANYQKTFHQVETNTGDQIFIDLTADLAAWAGTPALGTKAWIRLTPVNQYGITGQDLIQQTPVIAAMPITAPVLTSPHGRTRDSHLRGRTNHRKRRAATEPGSGRHLQLLQLHGRARKPGKHRSHNGPVRQSSPL